MVEKQETKVSWGKRLRDQFVTGLLVIVPLGASILILVWIFNSVDNILQPVVRLIWHHNIPGVGFAVTIIVIYLAGLIARNFVGRRILRWGDSLLNKVPVFRMLYRGIRQILDSFAAPDKTGFMQVVLVDFPYKGMKALGFITNEICDKNGEKLISVLIPTAPNPMTGFMQIVKESDIIRTQISIDEAIKMVVSAGRMMPEEVQRKI